MAVFLIQFFDKSLGEAQRFVKSPVLTSSYDGTSILGSLELVYLISTIVGRIFQLFAYTVPNVTDILPTIRSLPLQRIKMIIWSAHGQPGFMRWAKDVKLDASNLCTEGLEDLPDDLIHILMSCHTGYYRGEGKCIAQTFADVFNRPVFAPMDQIFAENTAWSVCSLHQQLSVHSYSRFGDDNGIEEHQQMMVQFTKDHPPSCCPCPEDEFRDYFDEQSLFVPQFHLDTSSPDDLRRMGDHYLRRMIPSCDPEKSFLFDRATTYYWQAAYLGSSEAQDRLAGTFLYARQARIMNLRSVYELTLNLAESYLNPEQDSLHQEIGKAMVKNCEKKACSTDDDAWLAKCALSIYQQHHF